MISFPLAYQLQDGTQVKVYQRKDDSFEFFLTRLNSEKHNFYLTGGRIEESYETRFDRLQNEAVALFQNMLAAAQ